MTKRILIAALVLLGGALVGRGDDVPQATRPNWPAEYKTTIVNWPTNQNVTVSGQPLQTVLKSGSSSALSVVTVNATSAATLANANATRVKIFLYNEAGNLYVRLGAGATEEAYTVRLTANTYFEVSGYSGIITGTKASGTSKVFVTEIL